MYSFGLVSPFLALISQRVARSLITAFLSMAIPRTSSFPGVAVGMRSLLWPLAFDGRLN